MNPLRLRMLAFSGSTKNVVMSTVANRTTGVATTYPSAVVARRVSWGAIFAGTVIGLAMIILFTLLAIGIGAATVDPASGQTPSAAGSLTGSAIAFAVIQLVGLFVGGYAAARLAGIHLRLGSMLHGVAVWALATFAMFWLATTTIGTIAGGLASTLASAAQGAATAVQAAIPDDLSLGDLPDLDMQSLPPELRRTLEQQGITLEQAREQTMAAFREVISSEEQSEARDIAVETAQEILRDPARADQALEDMADQLFGGQGAVLSDEDRQEALAQMQERLGISEAEAQQMIDQAQEVVQQAQAEIEQAVEQARTQAAEAAEATASAVSGAAFSAFVASLLGLIAAVVGGLLGRPREPLATAHE